MATLWNAPSPQRPLSYPNVYFTPGRQVRRINREPLPACVPLAPIRQTYLTQLPRHTQVPDTKNKHTGLLSEVTTIPDPISLHTQTCISKFKEWYSGTGNFGLPPSSENALIMEMSARGWISFREGLHIETNEK